MAAGHRDLLSLAIGWWSSGGVTVPTVPGLEFTLPANRMHYTLDTNRMQFILPENRMQMTAPEED